MKILTASKIVAHRGAGEDRAAIIEMDDGIVLVVADGAGGQSGGREAAEIAVQSVRSAVSRLGRRHEPETWQQLLAQIDTDVEDDPAAGETTAVIAAV